MNKPFHIILLASLSILVFDTLISLLPINSGFFAACLALFSLLLYAIAGFLIARRSSLRTSVLAGLVIGLVQATIGGAIFWIINPEGLSTDEFSVSSFLITAPLTILSAMIPSFVGGGVGVILSKAQAATLKVNGTRKAIRIVTIGMVWLLIVSLVMFVGFFIGLAVDKQEGLLGLVFGFFGLIIGLVVATLFAIYHATKIWPVKE